MLALTIFLHHHIPFLFDKDFGFILLCGVGYLAAIGVILSYERP